ncbi:phosphatase PAP2 family protein [Micromonospora sp. KC606]|uniref:phosphatase PAP2 family protein n=1 Tax=Micromonospora sp. KC606 TaxID=2530379 RepID=UPI0010461D3E|nr:phosphatase PAP2 family protein [Micromonospora sp. KC606]TDC83082.1 phosphatase PAP2 family protein [Micromonospora sp. KC606]
MDVQVGTADVPAISVEWYRDIVEFADSSPPPVQWFAGHFTEAAILLLGVLFLLAAAPRLRRGGLRERSLALVTPGAVVLSYAVSEGLKTIFDEDRPCRHVVRIVAGQCPPAGDWSFPSNHSTIAGALAVATVLLSRRLGLIAAPLALLAAFSRVFIGVHYPHDVAAGLLLGALVTLAVTLLAARPVADLLARRAATPVRNPPPVAATSGISDRGHPDLPRSVSAPPAGQRARSRAAQVPRTRNGPNGR